MSPHDTIKIESDTPDRLDRFLAARFPDWSRMYFKRLIQDGSVLLGGRPVKPNQKLLVGQELVIQWPEERPFEESPPQAIPFPVIYEDPYLMVIDKPAGLLTHPTGSRNPSLTLMDYLRPRVESTIWPDKVRPGLVHRLDKDTSGVLVFAKRPDIHASLSKQFADRKINKTYFALVKGRMTVKKGVLECIIGRDPRQRKRFAVTGHGKVAITEFTLQECYGERASLIELHPLTGRTHQLRVQLAAYAHPILGDKVYGGEDKDFHFVKRHLLHAAELQFLHPKIKRRMTFKAPLPSDFQEAQEILRTNMSS